RPAAQPLPPPHGRGRVGRLSQRLPVELQDRVAPEHQHLTVGPTGADPLGDRLRLPPGQHPARVTGRRGRHRRLVHATGHHLGDQAGRREDALPGRTGGGQHQPRSVRVAVHAPNRTGNRVPCPRVIPVMVPYRVPPPAAAPAAPAPPTVALPTPAVSAAGPGAEPAPARPLLVAALVPLLLAGCVAVGSSAVGSAPAAGVPAAPAAGTPHPWGGHMPQWVGYVPAACHAASHRVAVASHGATVREVFDPGWAVRAM